MIHSAIHAARPDAECVLHTHALNGTAESVQKDGLLPITQHAGDHGLGYHDYEGIALRAEERPRRVSALGCNQFLMLRNPRPADRWQLRGVSVDNMYLFETACAM